MITTLNLDLPPMSEIERDKRRQIAAQRQKLTRQYAAGQINRLNGDWATAAMSPNQEIRQSLRNLRTRTRNEAHNNPYMRKFLRLVPKNVVGHSGIALQAKPKNATAAEEEIAKTIEAAWLKWGRKEFASASGKLTFLQQCQSCIRWTARDGETLWQKIPAKNPFGFSLKYIDPAWLDETFSAVLPGGNRVIMSVEVDANNRVVAYHLRPPAYDYLYPESTSKMRIRQRIPANQIIHVFIPEDDEAQTRGVPWPHAAMDRLRQLGQYEEAELVAARMEACKAVYYKQPKPEFAGDPDDDDNGLALNLPDELEPGSALLLPPGVEVETYDPQHPNTNQAGFSKAMLRGVATGLDVAYVSLANDLTDVNYSSIKAGLFDERDGWKLLHVFLIDNFCREVYRDWLRSSILNGAIDVPPDQFERFAEPNWRPRGWPWIDPKNDVQSSVLLIENGMASRTDILAQNGDDIEDTIAKLKHENELIEEAGIEVGTKTQILPDAPESAKKP